MGETMMEAGGTTPLADAQILLVDDEEANVHLLERTLKQSGYSNIGSTTDSRQVPSLVAELQPDLIVLDLLMPHLDGFSVMRQLSDEIPEVADIPILILTADSTPEAKRRALAAGAKDFLTKPFDVTEVVARIENLLEIRFLRLLLQTQDEALKLLRELAAQSATSRGARRGTKSSTGGQLDA